MQNNHEEILSEVFCAVFEALAFMFGELTDKEELPRVDSSFIQTRTKIWRTTAESSTTRTRVFILSPPQPRAELKQGGRRREIPQCPRN